MGSRWAWRRKGVDEGMRRRADESGECWDFEYQRCMGYGSFGRTAVGGQWNRELQGCGWEREERGGARGAERISRSERGVPGFRTSSNESVGEDGEEEEEEEMGG
jgi:hypothetical protein